MQIDDFQRLNFLTEIGGMFLRHHDIDRTYNHDCFIKEIRNKVLRPLEKKERIARRLNNENTSDDDEWEDDDNYTESICDSDSDSVCDDKWRAKSDKLKNQLINIYDDYNSGDEREINISKYLNDGIYKDVYNKLWSDRYTFQCGLLNFYMACHPNTPEHIFNLLATETTYQSVISMRQNRIANLETAKKNPN